MTIGLFVSVLVNGVAMGMVYAMLGMCLILLIRAVGMLNFAQGDILMFGAFICAALVLDFKLPFWAMLPLSLVWFAILGIIFMFCVYWPLRKASYPQATIIATMGASIVLREGAMLIWGKLPRTMKQFILTPEGKAAVIRLGNITLQWQYIVIIVVGALLMVGVYLLFERLYIGKCMQAASQDQYAANLIGIPTIVTIAATYVIVFCLAGLGGYMVSPVFLVKTTLASMQMRAFAGVVVGGFGNIKGAIYGSIIVGITESFSALAFSEYKDVTIFLLLLVILLIRPQGLFGERIADKA